MFVTVSSDKLTLSPGSEVILRHQTWADYEQMLTTRAENSLPKLYFNGKTQEIRLMSPLPSHGNRIDTLRDLVKSLLRRQGKDWHCFDPITLKRFQQAGVEPDTCFYVNNRQAILGKEKIDLALDPPPDLAIEVDLTSITDVKAYIPLQIPEIWIYHRGQLSIYLFEADNYRESSDSVLFDEIDVKTILPRYVELAWNEGSSVALKQFERDIER